MPPGDTPARRKAAAPRSLAYVLSQVEGPDGELRWHIVDRSGRSAVADRRVRVARRPGGALYLDHDMPVDFEAGGEAGALAAMEGSAEDRERFALALPGDRHVLFLAVLARDLPTYGVRP